MSGMYRTMFKSKIHRATVTQADLNYVGSITIDPDLMDAADLLAGEQVAVVDVTNGARLETYVIEGERGSGVIGINGAAAHLVHTGDLVIIISYASMPDASEGLPADRGVRRRGEPDRAYRQRHRLSAGARLADLPQRAKPLRYRLFRVRISTPARSVGTFATLGCFGTERSSM